MLKDFIDDYLQSKKIPGGVIHVQRDKEILYRDSFGSFLTDSGEEQRVTTQTLFDIASLTKVVATLPAILVLLNRKQIFLDDPVQKYISQFRYSDIKIIHLLLHNSGLPADLSPPIKRGSKRDVFTDIIKANVILPPGKEVIYSDLGMILLGKIIETISGKPLDKFVELEVLTPLGMSRTCFNPPTEIRSLVASTEKLLNGTYIQGQVHDEKAFLLNGVAGSAGLFSCVDDLVKYAEYWLNISPLSLVDPSWKDACFKNTFKHRGLGFEVWNGVDAEVTISTKWTAGSFGHTGFTGTSIWLDPKEKVFVVLLTNAIHFGREAPKREFRLGIHESVYEKYIKKACL